MDVKWIKITTGIFADEKIKLIDAMPERDAIFVIWIKLLTLAGKINADGAIYLNNEVPYTDEMLATIFDRPVTVVRLALKVFSDFKMVEIDNSFIEIINWEKHQNIDGLDKIREQTRVRNIKYRERKQLQHSNASVTSHDATDKNRLDKNREEKNYKNPPSGYIALEDSPTKTSETFTPEGMQRIATCVAKHMKYPIGTEANIVTVQEVVEDYEKQSGKTKINVPIDYAIGIIKNRSIK